MAKLGTKSRHIVAHVQTQDRATELLSFCNEQGWQAIIGIEPDKPEDISDIIRLQDPPPPAEKKEKIGRNEPCPCGSGKKHKKCCLDS